VKERILIHRVLGNIYFLSTLFLVWADEFPIIKFSSGRNSLDHDSFLAIPITCRFSTKEAA
jgi:hypothetical protein